MTQEQNDLLRSIATNLNPDSEALRSASRPDKQTFYREPTEQVKSSMTLSRVLRDIMGLKPGTNKLQQAFGTITAMGWGMLLFGVLAGTTMAYMQARKRNK
jgi:hypothetical protein